MKTSSRIRILALLAPLILAAAVASLGYRLEGKAGAQPAGPAAQPTRGEASGGASADGGRGVAIRPRPYPDFTVTVDTDRQVYYVGEAVEVRFRASDDCRVYIFNTDSDGVTRQVFPNYYDRDNALRGDHAYTIPIGRYRLVATGPPGGESLRIVAYRRAWRALEPWDDFSSGGRDPFPQRSVAPDEMRKRVEGEARGGQEDSAKPSQSGRRGGLAIVPMPPDRYYYDYAEDSTRFKVQSRRYYPDPWGDGPPPVLR
jgi:Domain of unknown function (DUF4384)